MEILSFPQRDKQCKISFLRQMSVSETYHLHSHDFYEIFFVVKGRAMHLINGVSECCLSGTAELIRPDDCHEYDFINRYDMEIISMGIERSVMEEILDFLEIDPKAVTSPKLPLSVTYGKGKSEKLCEVLTEISKIADDKKRRSFAKAEICRLLTDMLRNSSTVLKIPFWLEELISHMSRPENFCEGLKRMLELSHVSQNHLNRELKKYLGLTPTEFINSKRIDYAGQLLLENKYSITEIAGLCGFETSSNFYENFRRIYDLSPKEFIKAKSHQYTGEIRKIT